MTQLLPPSSTALERSLEASISRPLAVDIAVLWDAANCPADALPWLAWALHVDNWDEDASEAEKRAAIQQSVLLHKKKGTPWALKQALATLGVEVEIIDQKIQREIYAAANPDRLDGTWKIDGSHKIRALEMLFNLPQIQHWAEFIVRTNLASISRPQIYTRLLALVNEWKPARAWPILVFWIALTVDISVHAESSIEISNRFDVRYPWCGRVVSESPDVRWKLGRDGTAVTLPAPFGSFKLGELRGGYSSWRLKNCRSESWVTVNISGETSVFQSPKVTIGRRPRALDGSWQLGARKMVQSFQIGRFALMKDPRPSAAVPVQKPTIQKPTIQKPTARYNTKIVYGQSLGRGNETWPALSRTARFDNRMLGGGVLPAATDGSSYPTFGQPVLRELVAVSCSGRYQYSAEQEAALAPGHSASGEPVNHGWLNFAKHLHNTAAGIDNDTDHLFVTINPSVSGKSIEQLSKNNTQDAIHRYSRFLDGLTKIQAAAGAESHVVDAIMWMQGETNYFPGYGRTASQSGYKAKLKVLFDDMRRDVKQITGQDLDPAVFLYQTGAAYTRDSDESGTPGLHVGMAQLETAIETPGVWMVGPVYPYTDKGGHLDSNGSRWFGNQIAKVYHRVVEKNEDWQPLRPLRVVGSGRSIAIDFHVPAPPLVFAMPYVGSEAENYPGKGFSVTDDLGTVPISHVAIVGADRVEITLARDPGGPVAIWYANKTQHNGNGCLRDSDHTVALDSYVYEPERGMYATANIPALIGRPYPLHNWCVAFHMPVVYF